jgi:UDP-sulfoquinovose synthase
MHEKLMNLGLVPHYLGDELVHSMLKVIDRYRDRVITRAIEPRVRWRPGEISSLEDDLEGELRLG